MASEERIGPELVDKAGSRPIHPPTGTPLPRKLTGLLREPLWKRLGHELDARKEQIPAVLDALYEKAKRGDVPAARELRGWYDQGLGRPEGASLDTGDVDRSYADMTPEERARLRAGVIKRIGELEAQEENAVDDQPGSAPS